MIKAIYPAVEERIRELPYRFSYELRSKVRLLHTDGKWYLTEVANWLDMDLTKIPEKDQELKLTTIREVWKQFNRNAYHVIMLGVVDENCVLVDESGHRRPGFTLDPDQRNECVRLAEMLQFPNLEDYAKEPKKPEALPGPEVAGETPQ